jgi:hypothetical protein
LVKKQDTPKFKAFSKKKGLKSATLRILGDTTFKKVGLSFKKVDSLTIHPRM